MPQKKKNKVKQPWPLASLWSAPLRPSEGMKMGPTARGVDWDRVQAKEWLRMTGT